MAINTKSATGPFDGMLTEKNPVSLTSAKPAEGIMNPFTPKAPYTPPAVAGRVASTPTTPTGSVPVAKPATVATSAKPVTSTATAPVASGNQTFKIDGGNFVGTQAEYDKYLATHTTKAPPVVVDSSKAKTFLTDAEKFATDQNKIMTDQAALNKQGYSETQASAMSAGEQATGYSQTGISQELDSAYGKYQAAMAELDNATFSLSPGDQAQIDAVKMKYDQLAKDQAAFNQNYTGGVTTMGVRSGLNRYGGALQMQNIAQSISQGVEKVKAIEASAAAAVSGLIDTFKADWGEDQESKYKRIESLYKTANDFLTAKSKTIKEINAQAKADIEAEQNRVKQNLENRKLEQEIMKSDMDTTATGFTYLDADGNVQMPDESEIAGYAEQMGMDPAALIGAVRNKAYELSKMSQEDIQREYDIAKSRQDLIPQTFQEFEYAQQAYGYTGTWDQFVQEQKMKEQAAPTSYQEWNLAGGQAGTGKTYAEYISASGGKPPTAIQQASAGYALRMASAAKTIDSFTDTYMKAGLPGQMYQKYAPNFAQTPEMQQMEQAKRNFINAKLRQESGAAIAPSEFESADKQYFPQPGDSPEVIQSKKANRDLVIQSMIDSSGSAINPDFNKVTPKQAIDDYYTQNSGQRAQIEQMYNDGMSDADIAETLGVPYDTGQDFKKLPNTSIKGSAITTAYDTGEKGGQCGTFAHKLVDFPPVGDSKEAKIKSVSKFGVPARVWRSSPKVGDVIITDESKKYGHVAVVNAILPNGEVRLTESNMVPPNQEKVSNTRTIALNSPRIYGAIRGTMKV